MGPVKRSVVRIALGVITLLVILAAYIGFSVPSTKLDNQMVNTASSALPTVMMRTDPSTPTASLSLSLTPTRVFTPENLHTLTPDTRLMPSYWREWPVNPDLSPNAQEILHRAGNNPVLNMHTFSKVGDCQMTSGTFLGGFTNGNYTIPDGFSETVTWFSESMSSESVTAVNGLGISSVLNPMFGLAAGNMQCQMSETPLDCELRTRHPAIVLIAMGTNWIPHGEASFEKYLRVVVLRIMETGALPILATKADNIEGDWKLNQAIAQVAYDYDLPLVNVWHSVQELPNHGLESPKNIYLSGDGWMQGNFAWLRILEKVRKELAP